MSVSRRNGAGTASLLAPVATALAGRRAEQHQAEPQGYLPSSGRRGTGERSRLWPLGASEQYNVEGSGSEC